MPKRSALMVILATLGFAGMGAIVKATSPSLSTEAVVFFRNAFGLLVLLPWIGWHGGFARMKTSSLRLHLLRSLAGLGSMYCFFFAISHLRLADAVLLNYTVPLFMPFFAFLWLGEEIPRNIRTALVIGFVGVALILKPASGIIDSFALVGLCAGILGALAQVTIRRLTRTESITRIVFYFGVVGTLVSSPAVLQIDFHMQPEMWGLLALMGFLATAAQLLLTRGYSDAPAAQVGPFIYCSVIFAMAFDWAIWAVSPDVWSLLGTLLVCSGGILTISRGKRGFRRRLTIDA